MDDVAGAGTATILFTDMVGSTELRMRLGDEAADRLRRDHDELLSAAVVAHDGTVVKSAGDGIMAAFPAASAAVDAAVDMQLHVDSYARRANAVCPFAIRIGISVGEITVEAGDYFGEAVIEAARLESEAAPGEILVSDVVRRLARRRTGAEFLDAGERTLKGLPEQVLTYRVAYRVEEATRAFPQELAAIVPREFCGRDDALDELSTAWADARSGRMRCWMIGGDPGIGKTTLAAVAARAAAEDGATVLYGRCDEGLHLPYQPFAEAFRAALRNDPGIVDSVGDHLDALAAVVPGLARTGRGADRPAMTAEPDAERARLFDGVASLLAALADEQPLLLVLDDLQWAETPTVLLVRHLLRVLADQRVLLVVTFRDTDIGLGHPLGDVLADSHRTDQIGRTRLAGMTEPEVAAVLESHAGGSLGVAGAELARRLHEESGGSPFFVTELVLHLLDTGVMVAGESGAVVADETTDFPLPASIREVVGRRLAQLPRSVLETLTHAAVVGHSFAIEVVAASLERDVELVLDDLEAATTAALVHDSERAGRFDFAHALVRTSLLDDLGKTRLALLHRRVGEVLEALSGDHLSELAYHWRAASVAQDVNKAVDYTRRAGRRDLTGLAWEAAALQFDRALALLEPLDKADPVLVAETALDLAAARRQTGDSTFQDAVAIAADAARAANRSDLLGRAALGSMRAGWWFPKVGVVDDGVVGLCEEALAGAAADDALRPLLLANLATNLAFDPDRSRREQLIAEALACLDDAPDETRAAVLIGEFHALWDPLTLERREQISADVETIAVRLGDRPLLVVAGLFDVCCRMERGDLTGAERQLVALQPTVDETRVAHFAWLAQMMLVNLAIIRDEPGVEQRMDEVLELGLAGGNEDALAAWGGHAAALARARGGFGDMAGPLALMVEQFPLLSAWRVGLALAAATAGDLDEAERIVGDLTADGIPMDYLWMVGQFGLVDLAGRLGRPELAQDAWDALLPFRDRWEMTASATASFGLVRTALAEAALLTGRVDEAVELAQHAVDDAERMGARYFATRSRRTLAQALGAAGRSAAAAEIAAAALEAASRHGFGEELEILRADADA